MVADPNHPERPPSGLKVAVMSNGAVCADQKPASDAANGQKKRATLRPVQMIATV